MSSCREFGAAAAALLLFAASACAASAQAADRAPTRAPAPTRATPAYKDVGRAATSQEIAAWNIDVRPDFQGLPKGSGSVAKGQEVWESKCASCHGIFGESREVFNPIVGGTTKADVQTGHVARLRDPAYPERTAMMKLSTLSTLWDFINRAMPWTAPKSLATDDVYAVTAYILNLAGVLPDDFVLSDKNMAQVQQLIPNRNGMTTRHAMWPGPELGGLAKPDVQGSSCMKDCEAEPKVASFLPDFARNAHGNLAEQNRLVGPQRGADTTRPAGAPRAATKPVAAIDPGASNGTGASLVSAARAASAAEVPAAAADPSAVQGLLQRNGCVACHARDSKLVGPAFVDVARKHSARSDVVSYLAGRIKGGGSGTWGAIPMPPQSLSEGEAQTIAQWLAEGAKP